MPKLFKTLDDSELIQLIKGGGVGVLPTDTVYGLAARADSPEAVEKLYAVKRREGKPGTLIASSIDQLVDLGIKRRYLTAVEQYWPNPISIIIPTGQELAYILEGKVGLAVRIPRASELVTLLEQVGPLVTTSANLPGEPPAGTLAEAQAYFGDTVDFYVDGGDLSGHAPSTVIRMVDDAVEIIRPGAVTINEETGEIVQ